MYLFSVFKYFENTDIVSENFSSLEYTYTFSLSLNKVYDCVILIYGYFSFISEIDVFISVVPKPISYTNIVGFSEYNFGFFIASSIYSCIFVYLPNPSTGPNANAPLGVFFVSTNVLSPVYGSNTKEYELAFVSCILQQ